MVDVENIFQAVVGVHAHVRAGKVVAVYVLRRNPKFVEYSSVFVRPDPQRQLTGEDIGHRRAAAVSGGQYDTLLRGGVIFPHDCCELFKYVGMR